MTNREKKRTYLKYIPPTDISDIFYNKPKPAPLIIDVSGLHWPHYDISCVLVKPDISGHYCKPDISMVTPSDISFTKIEVKKKSKSFFNR